MNTAETARARATDPQTSHEAAKSVDGLIGKRMAVLLVMQQFGPMTLEELVARYETSGSHEDDPQSDSGIRTRLHELTQMNPPLVVDSGERRKTASGRSAIVWRAFV